MAKGTKKRVKAKGEHLDSTEMSFDTFSQWIRNGTVEKVHALGARDVLDYVMEGCTMKRPLREPIAPNNLFLSFIPCQIFFKLDPVSADFGMCLLWFMEGVGFNESEIQDAFLWFFGGAGQPEGDEIDVLSLRGLQGMCNVVFKERGWNIPFPQVTLQ